MRKKSWSWKNKMNQSYQFKTNREAQWALLEKRYIREGYPKKVIDGNRAVFFGDLQQKYIDNMSADTALRYWPDRRIEGWQDYFDNYCSKVLTRQEVLSLQFSILSGFYGSYQRPEDDAFYVENLWAKVWEPNLRIKLRIPVEKGAIYPLDPNVFFACGGSKLSSWIKEREDEDQLLSTGGYMRFLPDFFRQLIPHLDSRAFVQKKYHPRIKMSEKFPVMLMHLQSPIRTFIAYAHKPQTGNPFYDERIAVAKQFYSMFDEIKEQLGDFSLLVEKTLSEE